MRRTTGTNRVTDKFGAGKDGHRDRVMDGAVIVSHGTAWEADMADSCQEELCAVVEDEGDTLDEDDLGQVSTVIQRRVKGPSSATDNAIARFDGTTGKLVQNSAVTIADTTGDIAGAGTITYGAAKVRSIVIPSCAFVPENSTIVTGLATDGSYRNCGTDSAHFLVDLSKYLTDRCTITAYGVEVHPGEARSGANKMTVKLYRNPFPSSAVQLGSGDSDDGTANAQLLDETLGTPHAVDREANGYTFDVKCGNTSASFADAILYGFVTISEAGPGLGT